jgi:plastocyanin
MFKLFAASSLAITVSLLTASALEATGGGGRGGGCHQPLKDEHTTEVTIDSSCYSPTIIRVQPGEGVSWTNRDDAPHNIIGAGGTWGTPQRDASLLRGGSFTHTFETAGIFPYYCSLHPGMVGVVAAGDFEVTEAMPDQALQFGAAPTSSDGADSGVPVTALAGVGIGVTLAMVGNGIVRNRRGVRPKS